MKPFKPMLAATCTDVSAVKFPVIASVKLDGVRATIQGGRLLSRTLKPIPNWHLQRRVEGLPDGLDGELISGDPTAKDCYRKTVSIVMSEDKMVHDVKFFVFDRKGPQPFATRLQQARLMCEGYAGQYGTPICFLPHITILTPGALEVFEEKTVAAGHEGVMLRSPDGPYKEGRSTEREGFLLKLKRFLDGEAEVIGVTELMHNGNVAKINELGRTERSSHKAGLVGKGILGALCVRGVGGTYDGVDFEIGTGFTARERKELWELYGPTGLGALPNCLAKYKYFALGPKDKPRFPVFLGWRDKRDV